jgi:uncharacterized 2Fe-2S/4Fe-4S cluster protein (DUF4445 family)
MYKLTFKFENMKDIVAEIAPDESILDVARNHLIAIDAPCSGNGICGKCRVKLLSGQVRCEKSLHLSDEDYNAGWRLACISYAESDITVLVPASASAYRSGIKISDLSSSKDIAIFKTALANIEDAGIARGCGITVLPVKMDVPSLDDTMPDNERLSRAISELTDVPRENIILPFVVIRKLPEILRESNFDVKCVIKTTADGICVYNIFASEADVPIYGLSIDIGTTTVSAACVDLTTGDIVAKGACGNGQIRFGADVINRIIESTRPGGHERLRAAIVDDTINPLITNMCRHNKIEKDTIYRLSIAGNTTMNHLLFGVNANSIRMEPYIPVFFEVQNITAGALGIDINPISDAFIAPNVGSYVGGDITAGVLASMIWNKETLSLFIDLGTNGELVFGNADFLMCCACSAGPAFEGGDISCGMRATDGAIEACTIDRETMEPTLSIIGDDNIAEGICGSGIIDVISQLFRCDIINAKGLFLREGSRVQRDEHGMGRYILAFAEQNNGREISITEVDIDNFIRAKGAIFSAIRIMLDSLDMDVSVIDHILVAGGIGSGINIQNAIRIGMLPDIPVEKYSYIGNSSLTGAFAALLSTEAEQKILELGRNMTYMELSTNPKYMDEFVGACFLPHTDATLFPSAKEEE